MSGRSHYRDAGYLQPRRLHSYAHQIEAILSAHPASLLEVGVGSGFAQSALEGFGVDVTTLDVQESVLPDIVGNVTAIPAPDGSWDGASCCQVLEHLPFNDAARALSELHRVTRRFVLLGLPDATRQVELQVRMPILGKRGIALSIPQRRPMPADRGAMGHRWEIGFADYPLSRVLGAIDAAGLRCERTWRVAELPWHRFFMLSRQHT